MNAAKFELDAARPAPGGGAAAPVVQVLGEIDVTNAARLQHELAEMAAGGLVVDLSRVGYLDSAGFAVLDCLLVQQPLAVVVSPEGVMRTAMVLMHLPFHDSIGAAQASLQPR